MEQRRAIALIVVVGLVVVAAMVGARWLGPPDTDDAGAGLFEGLEGRLGIGRDVRLDEVRTDGCRLEERDELSADEVAVAVPAAGTCRLAVEPVGAGAFELADRNRTLVLRPAGGSPTVTFRVGDVVVRDELSELSELGVEPDGLDAVLSCPSGCEVVIGRPPDP